MNKIYGIKQKDNNHFLETYTFDKNCCGIISTCKLSTGKIMKTIHKGLVETILETLTNNFEIVEIEEVLMYKEVKGNGGNE